MRDYHEQWMADRRAISANIDAAVADILREGYASISEPMPGPCRQHVKRANRDRVRTVTAWDWIDDEWAVKLSDGYDENR